MILHTIVLYSISIRMECKIASRLSDPQNRWCPLAILLYYYKFIYNFSMYIVYGTFYIRLGYTNVSHFFDK